MFKSFHYLVFFNFLLLTPCLLAVDRSNFKTCQQSGFCKRQRSFNQNNQKSTYKIDTNSIKLDEYNGVVKADLINSKYPEIKFLLSLENFQQSIFRFSVDEESKLFSRFRNDDVVVKENLEIERIKQINDSNNDNGVNDNNDNQLKLQLTNQITTKIIFKPFSIHFYSDDSEYLNFNSKNLLHIEHFRKKERGANSVILGQKESKSKGFFFSLSSKITGLFSSNSKETNSENQPYDPFNFDDDDEDDDFDNDSPEIDENGNVIAGTEKSKRNKEILPDFDPIDESTDDQWSETFKKFTDSKPRGPESIGMDVNFVNFDNLFGLPEHADSFRLRDTRKDKKNQDPYRLYNLDVFEYELDETMALYGSIPWVMAHNQKMNFGILWLNPSETWVDIQYQKSGWFESKTNEKSGSEKASTAHFMSESGVLDIFIMNGPTPQQTLNQLTLVSGRPAMPSLWSLGYHQCRWNYKDTNDVKKVDENFDKFDIPYDVIWLDIEHTDGKRYFTWDPIKFSEPEKMIENVARTGRKMVTIVDPHIKVDKKYEVFNKIKKNGLMTKDPNNKNDFEGWCWPGNSGYPDFTNKKMQDLWAEYLSYDNYKGSTENLYTWNDMNEPSVFNGPEITMQKDAVQTGLGTWEHRHVHNLYGLYVHKATYDGQILRNKKTNKPVTRPFVLSRAFYVGTQTAGAIWTGDNKADWGHLKASAPMSLSVSISGIPFVGADVGGFFGNPNTELLVRWYQIATTQPFFRAHAHIDSKRREPWLFGETAMIQIRKAIRFRYRVIHYLYTAFAEATKTGNPVMRPVFWEFPDEVAFFGVDNLWMTGDSLLSVMVSEIGQNSVSVSLPGYSKNQVWYAFPMQIKNFSENTIIDQFKPISAQKNKNTKFFCSLDRGIPVLLRGGKILLTKERARRNSKLMENDPYTMFIGLDGNSGLAEGQHFEDDQETIFSDFVLTKFTYDDSTKVLKISSSENSNDNKFQIIIERVIILRPNHKHSIIKKPNGVATSINARVKL